MLKIEQLTCNHEETPLLASGTLLFSWKLLSDERNIVQKAYQITVCDEEKRVLADSGVTESDSSFDNTVKNFRPEEATKYLWKVQVWDNHGNTAEQASYFETAPEGIQGSWIEASEITACKEEPVNVIAASLFHAKPKLPPEKRLFPVTLMRKEFKIRKKIKCARLYATAHGAYKLYLNGQLADKRYLAPEFTSYQKYLCYQAYDVTDYLKEGENACGVKLADGWWSGRIGMSGESCQYGDSRAFLMELRVYYEDGSMDRITSDGSFRWSDNGVIRYSDLFIGEKQDHRYADKTEGFSEYGFDDSEWEDVVIKKHDKSCLRPQNGSGIYVFKEFEPKEILTTPKGEQVVDFGQNIAGMVEIEVCAERGTQIKLEHSEMLNEKGNYINNILGTNKDQKDIFICSGRDVETFCDEFSFHGFRYVRVTGLKSLKGVKFRAKVLSTKMMNAAEFSCSDPWINQLYSNVRYSQYANMISIPTDCPQRERAGWTGDIQIYAPTACFHQNMQSFLTRWLENMMCEQFTDGQIPNVIPYNESYQKQMQSVFHEERSAGWGDACVIVPWVLYQQYGDKEILKKCWPMMEKWMDYVKTQAEKEVPGGFRKKKHMTQQETENQKFLWNTGWHFGDWLIPSYSKNMMTATKSGKVTKEIIASAYFAYTSRLMSQISKVLDNGEEKRYMEQYQKIRRAFQETYLDENGYVKPDLQGMYVCLLWFDLIPKEKEKQVVDHLLELIQKNNGCLDTGFLSTPLLLDVLCKYGHLPEAYELLYQDKCPSWLYEIKNGATTIWENWQAVKPDGKVSIYSYNHYAFGCVFDWIYRYVSGINMTEPAYHKIRIAPKPDRRMTSAATSHECNYGKIYSAWEWKKDVFLLQVEIPCNTEAEIYLPDGTRKVVGSGCYIFECPLESIVKNRT